jgi:hypothetical protein
VAVNQMEHDLMIKPALYVAVALVAAVPVVAFAQSTHMIPGEGYRIPEALRTTAQPPAAYQTDLSIPGNGYRIVAVPRTSQQPLAAYHTDPSIPGDGYRIHSGRP